MKQVIACLKLVVIAGVMLALNPSGFLYAAAAQSPERLFAELAKLKPEQRERRLEEGSRKEGKQEGEEEAGGGGHGRSPSGGGR